MKKLVMATAAVACAASIASAVTSANVVGYVKDTTPAAGGFDILNLAPFGTNVVSIQDAIGNLSELNASSVKANADKLHVWTGSGYSSYALYDTGSEVMWIDLNSFAWDFGASFATPAVFDFVRGQAAWYESGAGGTPASAVRSGEVPNDGSVQVDVSGTFAMLSYPYSASINLKDLVVTGASASSAKDDADKMHVWGGAGYSSYGLYDTGSEVMWIDLTSFAWDFGASFATPADADIDFGKGVWYESATGAKTLEFSQNYTID